jgi:hypothetical protein
MNAHVAGRNVTVVATGEDTPELRAAMRKAACGEAHTATIGKLLKVAPTGEGGPGATLALTWGPVTARGGALVQATPVTDDAPVVDAADADEVAKLTRKLAKITARLAELGAAPAPVKAAREVPEFIARARKVTCHTCRDLKVVRGVGADAGKPYRTQKGADAATAAGRSVKCPSHKRAARPPDRPGRAPHGGARLTA